MDLSYIIRLSERCQLNGARPPLASLKLEIKNINK